MRFELAASPSSFAFKLSLSGRQVHVDMDTNLNNVCENPITLRPTTQGTSLALKFTLVKIRFTVFR